MIKVFTHPNMENFLCPICGTNDDRHVCLLPIPLTEQGNIVQAKQVHDDCMWYWINYIMIECQFQLRIY